MAAAITVSPASVRQGLSLSVDGTGFLPNTKCTIQVPELGIKSDINSDVSGEFSTVDLADHAFGTLTSDGTVPTADDTVVVGSVTYTFKASVTTTANEVKLGSGGSAAADSLANLKAAINADAAGSGVTFGSATVVNPDCGAGALTATTLKIYAKTPGTAGNSLASTEASTHLSYGGTTLASGAVATSMTPLTIVAEHIGVFNVSVTDGTSTATAQVQVWT